MTGPFVADGTGVRVAVRLTPKGGRDAVEGVAGEADGKRRLKVRVKALPENGKANDALLRLLARQWKLPRTDVALVAGAKDRNKTIHVAGEPATLLPRLRDWLRQWDG